MARALLRANSSSGWGRGIAGESEPAPNAPRKADTSPGVSRNELAERRQRTAGNVFMVSITVYWSVIAVSWIASILALGVFVRYYLILRRVTTRPTATATGESSVPVAVVLCVRGLEDSLEYCLDGLLVQDHSDYHIYVVVDSEEDPSWDLVNNRLAQLQDDRMTVSTIVNRRKSCSLKCSAILDVLDLIDDRYTVTAFIDSDVIPHRTWLSQLATPFQSPRVGLVFGCRWFMSNEFSVAHLMRYTFGLFSAATSEFFRVPWGGSLAARTDILRGDAVESLLSRAFVEDTIYFEVMSDHDLEVHCVPEVLMPNRSECYFWGFLGWAARQVFNTKLYYPYWNLMVGLSLLFCGSVVAWVVVLATLLADQEFGRSNVLVIHLISQFILTVFAFWLIDRQKTRLLGELGKDSRNIATPLLRAILSAATSIVLMPYLTFRTYFIRIVSWRGVNYRVRGPWDIERLDYAVYGNATPVEVTTTSA